MKELPAGIAAGSVVIAGDLAIPDDATGVVIFAHGSGSSRHSPRNKFVARILQEAGLATLLIDLLTLEEEREDRRSARLRFDIPLLAGRLTAATDWVLDNQSTHRMAIGYFGASTGAAAALEAAADRPGTVRAVVSRGGRPDLAPAALPRVKAPTLLIVGGLDLPVIDMNQAALQRLTAEKALEIVPGATHLFEEEGTLDTVARLALDWFLRYLRERSGPDNGQEI